MDSPGKQWPVFLNLPGIFGVFFEFKNFSILALTDIYFPSFIVKLPQNKNINRRKN
jgi:hypothetical protein